MAASTMSGMFGQASTELAILPNLNSSHSGYIWHLFKLFLSELMLVRKKQHKKLKLCGETVPLILTVVVSSYIPAKIIVYLERTLPYYDHPRNL